LFSDSEAAVAINTTLSKNNCLYCYHKKFSSYLRVS